MVFNGTFNNISVISWRSGLLVENTIDTDKLYYIMLYQVRICVLQQDNKIINIT